MNRRTLALGIVILALLGGAGLLLRGVGGTSHASRDFTLKVQGSTMSPSTITVSYGDTINLAVVGDKAEELHIHGFDYKISLEPGSPQKRSFKADRTGSFEIEIEDTSTLVGHLIVNP